MDPKGGTGDPTGNPDLRKPVRCGGGTDPPPPPPPCDPRMDTGAIITDIASGSLTASPMTSPWTGLPGWGLPASQVAQFGLDVTVVYCNLEWGQLQVHKVFAPAGTSPVGYRDTGTGFGSCSSGTTGDHFGYWTTSGYPLDEGDFELQVPWWGPCSPSATSGTEVERLIIY